VAERDPEGLREGGGVAAVAAPRLLAIPSARKRGRLALMLSVPLLVVVGLGIWWYLNRHVISTDNAYVRQDKVSVAPLVTGPMVEIAVRENQQVKAGDLLFRIVPAPYRIALSQADAQLAAAQAHLTGLRADYAATGADITGARAGVAFYSSELRRESELMDKGFSTRARIEAAQHALDDARNKLASAEGDASKARAAMATGEVSPGVDPAILAARVAREKAELDLSHATIRAPIAGKVSQVARLQPGQMAIMGLAVATIVRNEATWVEANFKETQLGDMRVGQPARISFAAYPGLELRGHVASIGAGTGAEFAILPAQNASGNWVKVTQRVPVRIAIDQASPRPMIAGLSAAVSIDTGN
jgi:membrane fusion protein (multidrug efflux system)